MGYSKKYKKNSGRSFPYVNFVDCNELELKLMDWLPHDRLLNETMGLIVLRLHILKEEENLVEFCCYNKEDNSFKCIVNEKDVYDIRIDNLNDKNKDKEIVVIDNDIERTYKCERVNNIELGMRIVLSSYKKDYLYGLVKLTHYLSRDYTMFDIDYMDYFLRLKVVRPDNVKLPIFDENGRYSRYTLDNEEGLISYLVNEVPSFNLVDLYESICDISIEDISIYPEIYLDMSYGKDRNILDIIYLKYGELERFGMTDIENGKSLFLNKDNSWEYKNLDESMFKFSMFVDNDRVNYNISIDKNSDMEIVMDMIKNNILLANKDIKDVKVLSRRVVNMNKNSN